jgi:hypothetical protein
MKYVAVLALAFAVAVASYSAAAWSAAPQSPTERQLLRDVKTLKAQVAKLQKTDKTQTTNISTLAALTAVYGTCATAVTTDAIQGTWQIVDQVAASAQAGKTYFGAQTPVSDSLGGQSACQLLSITRSQAVPPTAAQLAALAGLFGSARFRQAFHLQH